VCHDIKAAANRSKSRERQTKKSSSVRQPSQSTTLDAKKDSWVHQFEIPPMPSHGRQTDRDNNNKTIHCVSNKYDRSTSSEKMIGLSDYSVMTAPPACSGKVQRLSSLLIPRLQGDENCENRKKCETFADKSFPDGAPDSYAHKKAAAVVNSELASAGGSYFRKYRQAAEAGRKGCMPFNL
jgi:hypothetical protein